MINEIISFSKIPQLNEPYLVAAWPGMGKVAIAAVNYLKEQIHAQYCGEIEEGDFFAPTGALVEKQIISSPVAPYNKFYYYQSSKSKNDIVIFIGSEQPVPHREYAFAKELLRTAQLLGVKKIFTAAAAPSDMHFKETPRMLD